MSARDDLIRCFERHASSAVSEEVANVILAKHAQELAAKVRETTKGLRYAPDRRKTLEDVADRIEEGTL